MVSVEPILRDGLVPGAWIGSGISDKGDHLLASHVLVREVRALNSHGGGGFGQ